MSQKRKTSWLAVLPTLVIPLCLGLTMYLGLSYLIEQAILTHELLIRYTTGHPISRVTTAMFFVGLASLLLIGKNVFNQFSAESGIELDPTATQKPTPELDATELAADQANTRGHIATIAQACQNNLAASSLAIQEHYLWQRLYAIVSHLHRSDSTATAEDELKYLSELDLERQQQRYALARILIWATPMLGFLGTVLGISEALGGIAIGPENNFESMMNGLRGSLYVAFDTTALALTLSMFLMFVLFLIDRFEMQLLSLVDTRTHAEVSRHFDLAAPENSALQSFSNEFLAASKQAVRDQTKIWAHSIHSAEQAWASTLSQTNDHVQENLTEALSQNFKVLSDELSASIDKADNAMAHRWQQWQVTLSENCRLLSDHQNQLIDQTQNVSHLVAGSSNEQQLKVALAQNKQAIAASEKLHESLATLAQSIQVLQKEIIERPVVTPIPQTQASADPQASVESQPLRVHQPADDSDTKSAAGVLPSETERANQRQNRQQSQSAALMSVYDSLDGHPVIASPTPEPAFVPPKSEVSFADTIQPEKPAIDSVRLANEKALKILSHRRPTRRAAA